MPTVAELTAIIAIDNAEFDSRMRKMESQMDEFARKTKAKLTDSTKAFQKFGQEIKPVLTGIGIGMAAALGFSIKKAVDFDSLKRGLTAVAGSAQEAEKQLKSLKEVAKLPGLGFEEAIQGSIRLQAAGLSAKTAEKSLLEFGNAIATVGGGKAQLDGVTLALSQIASKGKITAEELNQIAERVPQIRVVLKEAFGTSSTEEIQKMGITAEQFIEKVNAGLSKLPRVSGGVKNSIENMTDAINESARSVGQALLPVIEKLVGWVAKAVDWFNNLSEECKALLTYFSAGGLLTAALVVVAVKVHAIVKSFIELRTAMIAAAAQSKITGSVMTVAFGPVGVVVTALIATLGILKSKLDEIAEHELLRKGIEADSARMGEWVTAIRYWGKQGEKELLRVLEQFRALNAEFTDRGAAKAIAATFNNQFKQLGLKRRVDEYGNFVENIKTENEELAKSFEATAKKVKGLQPQWTRGGGKPLLSEGESNATLADPFNSEFLQVIGATEQSIEKLREKVSRSIPEIVNLVKKVLPVVDVMATGWHFAQISVGKFNETMRLTAETLETKANVQIGKFTEELQRTLPAINSASVAAEGMVTQISERIRRLREEAEDWAHYFADTFIYGLRRVREEGFAGLLRSFEEMLLDMAMAFLRSQLVSLMTSFFTGLLGAAVGGGGGLGGNGSSGGFGQTQTGFGMMQAPGGGGGSINITYNIMTPDVNSFRRSQAQIEQQALQSATANAMRNR